MNHKNLLLVAASVALLEVLVAGVAISAQDRYTLKVPGGLAFSEFKGYETWQPISLSHNGDKLALIVGNPAMIDAFKSGIPENGKPFPDGAKMAKIHWVAKKQATYPGQPLVAGAFHGLCVHGIREEMICSVWELSRNMVRRLSTHKLRSDVNHTPLA